VTIPLDRKSEEVIIQRGDSQLAGTLELPHSQGRVPALLMVPGSAAFDRSNYGLFDALADSLAAAGFATLRVDDRGTGQSDGVKHDLSADELADDILSLHSYLSARPEIDPRRVGLLGHSFGGALIPVVASRSSEIAFVITLAGYALTGENLMMETRRKDEESRDIENSQRHRILAFQQAMFDAAKTGGPWERVEEELRALHQIELSRPADEAVFRLAKTPWFESFLTLDPDPLIRSLRIPFLAIFGGSDESVPPELNIDLMRESLSMNPRSVVHVVPEANHFFRVSGNISEDLFTTITDWLVAGIAR
jgi:uncharacterized protein